MINPRELKIIKDKVKKERGLDLYQYKDNFVDRRINLRLHETNSKSYSDYTKKLDTDPEEYDYLFNALSLKHFIYPRSTLVT
ncbi:MAG: hypothetical protein QF824_04100 [Candidatus Woesearchaeota archaeon]|jgi:chemotaxis protein methyltransferase CheR|nr:hypothetical protein [Candidatus Woesearchaeota archaeon]